MAKYALESSTLLIIGFSLINFASWVNSASKVLKSIDTTACPCDNFYQFACGTYRKEKVINDDKETISIFSEVSDKIERQLKKSIEMKMNECDPKTFKLLQSLYNVCLNTDERNKKDVDVLKTILKQFGNWPVVAGKTWNESSFDWQELVYQFRENGYMHAKDSIVDFSLSLDLKNTFKYLITLDVAVTNEYWEYLLNGLETENLKAYYKYMVDVAEILGVERKQAEVELLESLNFEIDLTKISMPAEENQNTSERYNLMTIKELQVKSPSIRWLEYFNKMLAPKSCVNLNDQVKVTVPSFFESLSKLISKTPKRVVANYMIWSLIREHTYFMNDEVREAWIESIAMYTKPVVQERWQYCISYISGMFPQTFTALYARKSFDKDIMCRAQILFKDVRKSFYSMLKKIDWMDEETKKAALMKFNAIQEHIAYSDELFDKHLLDKEFGTLKVDSSSFLKSHFQVSLFHLNKKMEELGKPASKSSWIDHLNPRGVDANYVASDNSIYISTGILLDPFFTRDKPSSMNYGALGWIIGQHFTRGLDDENVDINGNLITWWGVQTKNEFLKRAQCVSDQYSNYAVKEVGLNINGNNTQRENIIDNSGIKAAYLAYEEFIRQNGEEPCSSDLEYSPRQMFWISAAHMHCEKMHPEYLKSDVLNNLYSPNEFRVIGSFSNMPQFAKDFQCPPGSPMNPVNKCTVW